MSERDRLIVAIDDDGRGVRGNATPGLGLASMRERAEELGGTFDIDSTLGRGTRVTAILPFDPVKAPSTAITSPAPPAPITAPAFRFVSPVQELATDDY
jgi:signal transduction histidine kinase